MAIPKAVKCSQTSVNKRSHGPDSVREGKKRHDDDKLTSSTLILMEIVGEIIKLPIRGAPREAPVSTAP